MIEYSIPNLGLVLYKAQDALHSQGWFHEELTRIKEKDDSSYMIRPEFAVYSMFPQTWGSTALGFGGIGGQALTEAYTVVIEERRTNSYIVFFNEHYAYIIHKPEMKFFEDVRDRHIASVYEAPKIY